LPAGSEQKLELSLTALEFFLHAYRLERPRAVRKVRIVMRAIVSNAAPEPGKQIKSCLQMLAGRWERMTPRCGCRTIASRGEHFGKRPIFSRHVNVNFFGVEPLQMLSDDPEKGVTGFEPVGIVVLFFAESFDCIIPCQGSFM